MGTGKVGWGSSNSIYGVITGGCAVVAVAECVGTDLGSTEDSSRGRGHFEHAIGGNTVW